MLNILEPRLDLSCCKSVVAVARVCRHLATSSGQHSPAVKDLAYPCQAWRAGLQKSADKITGVQGCAGDFQQ